MDNFFRHFVFVHTHIPKTAGTSFVTFFETHFGKECIIDRRWADSLVPNSLPETEKAQVRFLTGHFHAGTEETAFRRHPVYLALTRHPMERLISFYKFVRRDPQHPDYSLYAGDSFSATASRLMAAENVEWVNNIMCRFITGMPEPTWVDTLYAIEHRYSAICQHTSVSKMINTVAHAFLLPNPSFFENRGTVEDIHVEMEIKECHVKRNALDYRLHNYVCANEERLLSRFSYFLKAQTRLNQV